MTLRRIYQTPSLLVMFLSLWAHDKDSLHCDVPESAQAFGTQAKKSLSDLIFGRTVTVTSSKTDRYGRTLGKVQLEGKNIN
jgi:hypothetical protein